MIEKNEFPELEEGADQQKRERDTLDAVLAQLGDVAPNDLLLKVYRIDPATKQKEWTFDALPSDLPLEPRLLEEYGGGEFWVCVYSPTPGGSKSQKAVVKIRIARRAQSVAPAQSALPVDRLIEGIMKANAEMLKGFAEQQRLVLENTLLKSGAANPPAQGLTVEGLLQLMPLIKEMGGGQSKGGVAQMKDALELINEMRELAPAGGGGGGGGNELLGYVKVLADLAKNAQQQQRPAMPGAQPLETVYPELQSNPAPGAATAEGGADMFGIVLKGKLWELCDAAARGGRPDVYAEVILDQVPEKYYPDLLDLIGDDDATAITNLSRISPRVNEFQPWFAELATLIRGAFDVEGDDAGLTAGAPGDKSAADAKGKAAPHAKSVAAGAGEPKNKT